VNDSGLREWEEKYRLRPAVANKAASRWSVAELGRELERAGLASCVKPFARARIDGRIALTLTAEVGHPRNAPCAARRSQQHLASASLPGPRVLNRGAGPGR
jgi:hypothetical protein